MKKCPFCAEEIQDEAIVCRYCGRDLEAASPKPPEQREAAPPPPKPQPPKKKGTTSPIVVGLLAFIMGAFALSSAASVSSAVAWTILFAALTAGFAYYWSQKKISVGYGLTLVIVSLLLTISGVGAVLQSLGERRAEQARIEQQEAHKAREEQRLGELRANKDSNFAEGKRQLADGNIDAAIEHFSRVEEVDPEYDGLAQEMTRAREADLLAQLKVATRDDVHKRQELYQKLSRLRPDNNSYKQSLEQYRKRVAEADKKAQQERARSALRASAKLQLIDWRWTTEHGYAIAEGRVKNISNERLENIQASVTFKTRDGDFITADDAMIDLNPVLPGQTSNFKVMARANPAMHTASIDFKVLFGGSVPWYKE